MWRTFLISLALLTAIIVLALRFYRKPELQAEASREFHHDERPYDENNYPAHQVIRTQVPVGLPGYFRFMDSLSNTRQELRKLNVPGDRIIALANTWIIDSLASVAVTGRDEYVIPAGSRINIPDSATARWMNKTLRKNSLIIDLSESKCFVTSGTDTMLKAPVIKPPDGLDPQGISSDTIHATVIALHRTTHYGLPNEKYAKLPCLEMHTADGPIFLMGSAPNGWGHTARNFLHLSPADIWMVYHFAPPGTKVLITMGLDEDRKAIRSPRIGK